VLTDEWQRNAKTSGLHTLQLGDDLMYQMSTVTIIVITSTRETVNILLGKPVEESNIGLHSSPKYTSIPTEE
jgi:hypothetical protein